MKKQRVTMQDIADRLGITKMTVSRYFNNPQSVAQATGERIKAAVDELGFVPSRVPAMLAQAASKALGVIIPSFSNLVFADVIRGIEDEAELHGYTVLIMHSGYSPEQEERLTAELLSYQIDGLILTEPEHTELTRRRITAMSCPCVETMSLPDKPIQAAIGLDHREAMYRCTKALLQSGRRLPVYLGVRLDLRTMQRQEGYERAMREFGYEPFALDSAERSNFTLGGSLMRRALEMHPETDAVLATNDDVAVGAMLACQALKLIIPKNISILGYNGLNIGQATIPPLCSIRTPRREMGAQAVRLLLKLLSEGSSKPAAYQLPFGISEGSSVTAAEYAALQAAAQQAAAEIEQSSPL